MNNNSRILLPLDTGTAEKAIAMAAAAKDELAGFKVGLELINAAGMTIFNRLAELETPAPKIFYDCKFHDIPNTVAGAVRAASKRGVWMLNIHATGGSAMMRAAVKGAAEGADAGGHGRKPLVIGVTILTSIDAQMLNGELSVGKSVSEHVVSLARLAQDCGCDGVVASAHEITAIRQACGKDFTLVIPGIRPAGSDVGDQKRVMTPLEAVKAGADYLVIGRPISAAADPAAAARAINEQIAGR
jgi:orotidine-5'-phosphate decarboxylase